MNQGNHSIAREDNFEKDLSLHLDVFVIVFFFEIYKGCIDFSAKKYLLQGKSQLYT